MTAAQQRVYAFIVEFIRENSFAPTRREIANGLGFSSPNAAEEHLQNLAKLGALRVVAGGARKIVINSAYRVTA